MSTLLDEVDNFIRQKGRLERKKRNGYKRTKDFSKRQYTYLDRQVKYIGEEVWDFIIKIKLKREKHQEWCKIYEGTWE